MFPQGCSRGDPIVNSQLMQANEKCLKLFHQTNGLTSYHLTAVTKIASLSNSYDNGAVGT